MISYETELEDRVKQLVEDVGPLASVSLLGFVESDRKKADAAIRRLGASEETWCFLDLRAVKPEDTKIALESKISEPLLVLATRHDRLARPIINLVRAFVDKEPRVELGDYVALDRPKGQSMVLIVDGAAAHASLPNELRRVPYEEYLP
jgi:hypothetical protein